MKSNLKIIFCLSVLFICLCVLFSCDKNEECKHKDIKTEDFKADCDSEGYVLNTCTSCQLTYKTDIVAPTGHTYKESEVKPTCEAEGYTTYTCDCGFTYRSDFVLPLSHNYEKKTVAPTCESEGYTTYTCACGHTYKSDIVSPAGHKLESMVVAPTCTSDGYTTYTCACGYSYTSDTVPKTEHIYTEKGVEVTCTTPGYMEYTCECGYSYYTDFIPPKTHDFLLADRIYPTLTTSGHSKYVCNCGYEYVGNYIFYGDVTNGAYVDTTEPVAKGIDISVHQHKTDTNGEYLPLDWAAIAESGVEFVILRAGTSKGKDPVFEMNYKAAKEAGLGVGAYFYTYALTVDEATLDAHRMLMYIDGKQFDYPIYFDMEDPSQETIDREQLTRMTMSFFEILQSNGYYTSLYSNQKWLTEFYEKELMYDTFDIWYARWPESAVDFVWGTSELPVWDTELYGNNVGMWQFSESGTVPGIADRTVDLNLAYKDYPTIIKELGLNGYGEETVDKKVYVWVIAASLNVRSSSDFGEDNIVGHLQYGQKVRVLERTEDYIKILYNNDEAYISANTKYISDSNPEA